MKKSLLLLSLILCFLFSIAQSENFEQGKIYVKSILTDAIQEYDSSDSLEFYSSIPGFNSLVGDAGIYKIEKTFKILGSGSTRLRNIFTISFSTSFSADSLVHFLKESDMIEYAEKVPVYKPTITPVDSLYNPWPNVLFQWNLFKIDAENAWDFHTGNKKVRIGIIDTDYYLNHEDLKYKTWINQDELPSNLNDISGDGIIDMYELLSNYNILSDVDSLFLEGGLFDNIDTDGNGFTDDIFGWDISADWDRNINPPDSASNYYHGHGTHVSGIAGAETSDTGSSVGIASIGWNVSLVPVKCVSDTSQSGNIENLPAAIEYLIAQNVDVINMSLGSPEFNSTQEHAIQEAVDHDILIVAGAGNDGELVTADVIHYPAGYDYVISVGASDTADTRSSFSCYSNDSVKWVDVMSPGEDILSCSANSINSYVENSGTSMASPLVAGLCALMRSYCSTCTLEEITSCLFSSCDPMPDDSLYSSSFDTSKVGHGRINAYQAMSCVETLPPVADFESEYEFICPGSVVEFYSTSSGFITSYQWIGSSGITLSDTDSTILTISFPSNVGEIDTVQLVVCNSNLAGSTSCDTITVIYETTNPSAEIVYPTSETETCNDGSAYLLVNSVNANLPYDIYYHDNFGNYYSDTGIIQDPFLIYFNPQNDTTTIIYLDSIFSAEACFGTVADSMSFVTSECDCMPKNNNHWLIQGDLTYQFQPTITDTIIGAYDEIGGNVTAVFDKSPASISDHNGNFMFGFLSDRVFDKTFEIMENGDSIKCGHRPQNSLILPKYPNDSIYYLFTVGDTSISGPSIIIEHGFWYHVIDLGESGNDTTQSNPQGSVVIKNQAIETNGVEITNKLTYIQDDSIPGNYWLISRAKSDNIYLVHKVTPDTVTLHNIDTIGLSTYLNTNGYLRPSPNGKLLISSYYNGFELLSFNNQSGTLSPIIFPVDSACLSLNTTPFYGIEFSSNGEYFYTTGGYLNNSIYKYRVFENYPYIQCLGDINLNLTSSFGLQRSPDNQFIWIASGNSIGVISNINDSISYVFDNYMSFISGAHRNFPQLVPTIPVSIGISEINHDCNNNSEGSIKIQIAGGCPPYSIIWDDPSMSTGVEIDSLGIGTYTALVTDACNCIDSISVEILNDNLSITSIDVTTPCDSINSGSIDVSVSGGFSPLSYEWNGSNGYSAFTQDITGLLAGTYYFTVTDSIGCSSYSYVTVNPPFDVNSVITDPGCPGFSDGSIDLTVTYGSSPYSFLWNTSDVTEDLINIEDGFYQVTVTDSIGCVDIIEIIVVDPTGVNISVDSIIDVSCYSYSNGSIYLDISGGITPLSFNWSTGAVSEDITNLILGDYMLTISDENGCLTYDTFNISQPDPLNYNLEHPVSICNCSGSAQLTNDSLYTYLWFNNSTLDHMSGLCPDSAYWYSVIDSGNNCIFTDTFEISFSNDLNLQFNSDSSCNCNNELNLSVSSSFGPYDFEWSSGDTTEDLSNICQGIYNVTVSSQLYEGCIDTGYYFLEDTSHIYINAFTDDISCPTSLDGQLDVSVFDPYGLYSQPTSPVYYSWMTDTSVINADTVNLGYLEWALPGIDSVGVGTYYVSVYDGNGCFAYDNVTIDYIYSPDYQISSFTTATCGNSDGSIEFDLSDFGNTPWYINFNGNNYSTSDTLIEFVNIASGTYTDTIYSYGGTCWILYDVEVPMDTPYVDIVSMIPSSCSTVDNGSITFEMNNYNSPPFYIYQYNQIDTTYNSSYSIYGLSDGSQFLTVTDSVGCSWSDSFYVDIAPQPYFNYSITQPDCDCNGLIYVELIDTTTQYNYFFLYDSVMNYLDGLNYSSQTSFTFDSLCPGTYGIRTMIANACTDSVIWVEIEEFNYDIGWDISVDDCDNPTEYSIEINISGDLVPPYSYSLDGTSCSGTVVVPTTGDYILNVTDSNGCTVIDTITIETIIVMDIIITGTDPTCPDPYNGIMILDVSEGIPPYTYLWSNLETNDTIWELEPDIQYDITVTDSYGCLGYNNDVLSSGSLPGITSEIIAPFCLDSTSAAINIDIIGGDTDYTYSWTEDGNTFSSDQNIDSLVSGYIYSLTATGVNDGCLLTFTDTIPPEGGLGLIFTITGQTCDTDSASTLMNTDGKISVAIIGGSGQFTYLWSTGDTTSYVSGLTDSTIISVEVYDGDSTCYGTATDSIWWQQDISLSEGWGYMSTYLTPYDDDSIHTYFQDQGIEQELIIMKDNNGLYIWPAFSMYEIGDFTYNEGYQLKMNSPQILEMKGHLVCPEDNQIIFDTISVTWYYMSYLRTTPKDIEDCLSTILNQPYTTQSVEIVKNDIGNVLWPYWGLNNIGNMIPGEGYQININDNISFYYPANDTTSGTKSGIKNSNKVFKYFTDLYINTDNSMIVGIPENSWDIIPDYGDEIAAIGEHGQVVGRTIFEGGFSAIVLYGDDYYTEGVIEGLSENEQFVLQIWNSSTKSTRSMEIKSWQRGDGYFANNKISVAGIPYDEILDKDKTSTFAISIYPNPGTGYYYIEILSTIETTINMKVFNNNGQKVFQSKEFGIEKGINKTNLDLKNQNIGNYIIQITDGISIEQAKLILVK